MWRWTLKVGQEKVQLVVHGTRCERAAEDKIENEILLAPLLRRSLSGMKIPRQEVVERIEKTLCFLVENIRAIVELCEKCETFLDRLDDPVDEVEATADI